MTTIFDSLMQSAGWPSLVAQFGQTVTYTPAGGEGTSISAVWYADRTLPNFYIDSQQDVETGVLVASPADVTSPNINGDTVIIGGTTYAVVELGKVTPLVEMQLITRVRRAIGAGHERRR